MDSTGHRIQKEIWHERLPLLLTDAEAEEWMDEKTPPERAFRMIAPWPGDWVDITERIRPSKNSNS